jgi:hypothetical protein
MSPGGWALSMHQSMSVTPQYRDGTRLWPVADRDDFVGGIARSSGADIAIPHIVQRVRSSFMLGRRQRVSALPSVDSTPYPPVTFTLRRTAIGCF